MRTRAVRLVVCAGSVAVAACSSTSTASLPPPVHRPPTVSASPSASTPTASPAPVPTPSPAGPLKPIADEGHVSYSVTETAGECHSADAGTLPDPHCTPGSVDPKVTQATIRVTICVTGWTATVRPPQAETSKAKFDVAYPAYGDPAADVSELDHLVPLELGGSNDITNLWPELGKVPNPKDSVENSLREEVCAGTVTLAAAQVAIATDWHTAESAVK